MQLTSFYQDLQSEGVKEITTVRRGRQRSMEDNANEELGDDSNPPIDRVCLRTAENISVIGNSSSIATLDKPPRRMLTRSRKEPV